MPQSQESQMVLSNTEPANVLSLRRLQEYGLFPEDELSEIAATYRLKDITADEAAKLGFTNTADGIYIGYPNDKDSRIRYNRTGFQAQQDLGKYGQRPNTPPALYYPPTIKESHLADKEIPLLIIEGEFKALVTDYVMNNELQKPDLIPLAIGGVWSWRSAKSGVEVIPDLDVVSAKRRVYIAFDMDNPVKPQVQKALQRLVDKLLERGAECRVLSWPSTDGKGLDDYLANKPGPRDALLNLLLNAQTPGHVQQVIKMNSTYVYDKVQDMVWDFNTMAYIKPQTFKAHYFTDVVHIPVTKNGKTTTKPTGLGDYWLASPARAWCEGKTFHPGAERLVATLPDSSTKKLNTWTAWGAGSDLCKLQPIKGDVEPFIDYMRQTFSGNKLSPGQPEVDVVEYLIKRLAWIFQHPTIKHPTWIYLIGKPMQGKSKLINIITRLVGNTYTSHIDESALSSSFSEWRAEKLLIAFDDVAIMERGRIKQVLKRMTTEQTSRVNRKYEREYTAYSYETFFFATNSLDPLLDHDDRRAIVLEAKCPWTKEEWAPFDKWSGTPTSYNALLHYFMYEVKLDESFLTARPPITMLRELVTESAESGWDELLNGLASPMGVQWQAPACKTVRKFKPTIVTPEMLRALYAILQGPQDSKTEIKNATLTTKLQRFGASRLHPADSGDARSRVFFMGKQTTCWAWSAEYAGLTQAEMFKELNAVHKEYPELFHLYGSVENKF